MKKVKEELKAFHYKLLGIMRPYEEYSKTPFDIRKMCQEFLEAAGVETFELRAAKAKTETPIYKVEWSVGTKKYTQDIEVSLRYDSFLKQTQVPHEYYIGNDVDEFACKVLHSYYLIHCAKDLPGLSKKDVLNLVHNHRLVEVSVQVVKHGFIEVPEQYVTEKDIQKYVAEHLDDIHVKNFDAYEYTDDELKLQKGVNICQDILAEETKDFDDPGHNL